MASIVMAIYIIGASHFYCSIILTATFIHSLSILAGSHRSYLVCLMRSMTSSLPAALLGLGVGSSSAGLTAILIIIITIVRLDYF